MRPLFTLVKWAVQPGITVLWYSSSTICSGAVIEFGTATRTTHVQAANLLDSMLTITKTDSSRSVREA